MPTTARFSVSLVILVGAVTLVGQERSTVPMDAYAFRHIARRQDAAVVAITTKRAEDTSPEVRAWFERFFGEPLPQDTRMERELGSGFLISREGEILTNDHVIAGADVIEVGLLGDDTKTYRATLVGRDPVLDVALIKLENPPSGLTVATLGDSDTLERGDWVTAIGNPFRLGHTVTVGVVSHEGRVFEVAEGVLQRLIQTDASINFGNSGGPLLNVLGEVIGINAAILGDETGGSVGIGFAVPINGVKTLLPQLRAGRVIRGRIGATLHDSVISHAEATALGVTDASGALVTLVERDSPASHSGLHAGDLVIALDGSPVLSSDSLRTRVSSTPPGSGVVMTVIRNNRKHTIRVTVEELALQEDIVPRHARREFRNLGLTLADVTPAISGQKPLPADVSGAVVRGVQRGSPAAEAGLLEGDIIHKVNRHVIRSAAEAELDLHTIQAPDPLFLVVWRDGDEVLVRLPRD